MNDFYDQIEEYSDEKVQYGRPDIVIPAVILNCDSISNTERLLFGYIRNFASSEKGCFCSNEHFAKLLKCNQSTISHGIGNLVKAGFIECEYRYIHKKVTKRFITIKSGIYDETYEQRDNYILKNKKESNAKICKGSNAKICELYSNSIIDSNSKKIKPKSKTPPKTEEVKNPTSSERDFLKTNQSDFSLFRSAKNQVPSAHDHTKRLIHEFCKIYHKIMGVEHHNLTNDTYKTITKRIEEQLYLLTDSFEARIEYMFDRFFEMKFRRPADYSLFLFSTCIEQLAERARREIQ